MSVTSLKFCSDNRVEGIRKIMNRNRNGWP